MTKRSSIGQRSAGRTRTTVRGSGNRKTKPPMAKASKIPPGAYRSKIVAIKNVKTFAGDDAVEVIYALTDTEGRVLTMREVIPEDAWVFEMFCDALLTAGLQEDDDIAAAVGITEDVVLEYPDPHGLGHFTSRVPVDGVTPQSDTATAISAKPDTCEKADDDFEDFLEDDL